MTGQDPFLKRLVRDRRKIEAEMERLLPRPTLPPARLHEAMKYALFAGGKRLRPLLVLYGCRAAHGQEKHALPVAVAMEMIHTYSLVHDDLPAMDDDSLRRGKPTTHIVYGEAMAILVGDALLSLAFELLANQHSGASSPSHLLSTVARASGSQGMIGGQVLDLEAGGTRLDQAALEDLHRKKTGALIRAAVVAGALTAGAPETCVAALDRYGTALGLAFQITDDILDVTGSETSLGKSAGKDARDGKPTFASVCGLPAARREAGRQFQIATHALDSLGAEADPLRGLALWLQKRTS